MFLEFSLWTIAKVLIKLTKKYGKQWIKDKFNLDDKVIDLLYECVDNPEKIGDLISILHEDKPKLDVLETKLKEIKTEKEFDQENLLLPNSKLEYYSELLEEIFYISRLRNEPLVLEGFFTGENIISYFFAYEKKIEDVSKISNYISVSMFSKIVLERVSNEQQRKERVREQREVVRYAKYKQSALKFDETNEQVDAIYNDYIKVKEKGVRSTEEDKNVVAEQYRLDKNYNGYKLLQKSLNEYIQEVITDINSLRKASIKEDISPIDN